MNTSRITPVLRNIVLAGAFLMPFVVFVFSNDLFFPYVGGKNFAFRIIAEIIFFAWVALMFLDAEYRPRKNAIIYAILGFTGIMGVATIFSFNPLQSFWSDFERMEGYVTLLHLAGYFLALSSVMQVQKKWTWLFRIMLGVSVAIGMGGLAELGEANRVAGILGNAAYLGSYAMLHAGLALFLLVRPSISRIERYVYGAVAFFNLWVMYNTATRGAMVGFIVGAIIAALLYTFFARAQEEKRFRMISGGVIAMLIIIGGVFFAVKDSSFVTENRVLKRFASISLEDKTTRSRLLVWNLALEGWKERPILGWGQENFDYVFLKHYDVRLYDQEPFFDRAHNIFLDWLIAGGVLGLLGYLSLYGALLFVLWKSNLSVGEKSVMSGIVLGHGAQNFFVFDTITSYLVLYTLLSYVSARSIQEERIGEKWHLPSSFSLPLAGVAVVLGIWVLIVANIPAMGTSKAIIDMKRIAVRSQITEEEAVSAIERATEHTFLGRTEARQHLVQTAQELYSKENVSPDVRDAVYAFAEEEIRDECESHPLHPKPWYIASVLFSVYGNHDDARAYLDTALSLSPEKIQFMLSQALILMRAGEYDSAIEIAKDAYDMMPVYNSAIAVYIRTLLSVDRIDDAAAVLGSVPDDVYLPERTIAAVFAEEKRYMEAIRIWGDVLEEATRNGTVDADMYTAYASFHLNLGKVDVARHILEEAIVRFPDFKEQGTAYLNQLP
jgi:O-antigen ligase